MYSSLCVALQLNDIIESKFVKVHTHTLSHREQGREGNINGSLIQSIIKSELITKSRGGGQTAERSTGERNGGSRSRQQINDQLERTANEQMAARLTSSAQLKQTEEKKKSLKKCKKKKERLISNSSHGTEGCIEQSG